MSMLLALLTGAVISIMVSINGGLTACVGEYTAAVVIHVVGTAFALILCLIRRKNICPSACPCLDLSGRRNRRADHVL